jgi:hypothetical protein
MCDVPVLQFWLERVSLLKLQAVFARQCAQSTIISRVRHGDHASHRHARDLIRIHMARSVW